MKNLEKLTNIIESIVFLSGNPIEIKDISEKLELTDKQINEAISELKQKYSGDCGLQLLVFNKKLQFSSNPKYVEEVSSVLNPIKERELTRSMLEAAAIIAYKQPITKGELEEIRGSNSDYAVQKLLELKVIEPIGRKDAVGKPILYGTTDEFLKRFQISSLDELPDYDQLLEKIQLLHEDTGDDYLYRKQEYLEEAAATDVTDVSTQETIIKTEQDSITPDDSDFELPTIDEEEIPDFLKGEKVDKI